MDRSRQTPPVLARGVALTKSYRAGDRSTPALNGMNLEVAASQMVMITGESGSGKSTLLSLFGCLDKPDAGCVEIAGTCVSQLPEKALTQFRRQHIGFIFQNFHLIPVLTVLENIRYAQQIKGVGRPGQRQADELIELLGLQKVRHQKANELSGGQMQRVAIARALTGSPALILADEPTANLDSENKSNVMQALEHARRSQGAAVLLVTHDRELSVWADRVVQMRDGREIEVC